MKVSDICHAPQFQVSSVQFDREIPPVLAQVNEVTEISATVGKRNNEW